MVLSAIAKNTSVWVGVWVPCNHCLGEHACNSNSERYNDDTPVRVQQWRGDATLASRVAKCWYDLPRDISGAPRRWPTPARLCNATLPRP